MYMFVCLIIRLYLLLNIVPQIIRLPNLYVFKELDFFRRKKNFSNEGFVSASMIGLVVKLC